MPPKGLMHKDTPLNEDMNTLSVEGAQHSATPQTRPHLSHPISYYYHPSNPLPYYLPQPVNTFASSSPKKTDATIVARLATATKPVPTAVKVLLHVPTLDQLTIMKYLSKNLPVSLMTTSNLRRLLTRTRPRTHCSILL